MKRMNTTNDPQEVRTRDHATGPASTKPGSRDRNAMTPPRGAGSHLSQASRDHATGPADTGPANTKPSSSDQNAMTPPCGAGLHLSQPPPGLGLVDGKPGSYITWR